MRYGYKRVSTLKQGKHGNSLDDQEKLLRDAGAQIIFSDTYTGTKLDRPEFEKLLSVIKAGDELIVTKLDRLARSCSGGATLVSELINKGVSVNVLNMGKVDNSPVGKLVMQIMFAFSQFERDMIVERTQAGKAEARQKGIRVDGRPLKFTQAQLDHAMQLLADQGNSYTQVERMTGISVSTLVREHRKRIASE